ncbi:MAG: tyrosine-type recombinase/integrase [Pseudonocardiales bacterium]|nr:tyrosine-type recombinase/integrase [Pseudonocardiales bacterium]
MPNERLKPGEPPRTVNFDERTRTLADGSTKTVIRARAYICDLQGHRREVSASGTTRKQAERALRHRIATTFTTREPIITRQARLRVFAQIMLAEKRARMTEGQLSPGTLRNYEAIWRRHIEPALGDMAIEWVGVAKCDEFLKTLRATKGYATVKGARSVIAEILAVAIRKEAIPLPNPIEGCADIVGKGAHVVKALDSSEAVHIWYRLQELAATPGPLVNNRRYRPTMCDSLLPDLWLWMLGTGDRIGNALAARWSWIDMEAGTARLGPNVIRVPGEGLRINEGTSKSQEMEDIDLPEQVIAMLLARREHVAPSPLGLVFPNDIGGLLDPSNVSSKKLRPALKTIGYGHVSSHWCRRTLGSELDSAGMTLTEIAGRLRHSDSRTTERYYVRKRGGNPRVKAAIEAMLATEPRRH